MQSLFKTIVFVAASFLLVPQIAMASDLEADLQDMKERMERMEEQVNAQSDELTEARATVAEQQVELEAVAAERGAVSALSDFLSKTDISGHVAASYNFNFDGADTGNCLFVATNLASSWCLGYENSNTFQFDQAFITMEKAATEESRAGFNFAIQSGEETSYSGDSTSVAVYSAYVSYLAPIGNGLQIDAGIMPTLLGAEVEQTNANWNITRGVVWGLQPVTSTGIVASTALNDNISVAFGFLNEPMGRAADGGDGDNNKGFTSQISYSGDGFGVNLSFNYGDETEINGGNSVSIVDVVVTYNPTENLSAWLNFDYLSLDNNVIDSVMGIAAAARLAMSDSTGISGRYEYASADAPGLALFLGRSKTVVHTITATVDHSLTDNLSAKVELRYDTADEDFYGNPVGSEDSQTLGIAQLVYEF